MRELLDIVIESVSRGNVDRKYHYKGSSLSEEIVSMDFEQFKKLVKEYSGLNELNSHQGNKLIKICEGPLDDSTSRNLKKFNGSMYFDKFYSISYFVVADHLIQLTFDEYCGFFEYGNSINLNDVDAFVNMNNDQILQFLSDHTELRYLF